MGSGVFSEVFEGVGVFCGIKAPDRKLAGLKVKDLEFRKDGACSCRSFRT